MKPHKKIENELENAYSVFCRNVQCIYIVLWIIFFIANCFGWLLTFLNLLTYYSIINYQKYYYYSVMKLPHCVRFILLFRFSHPLIMYSCDPVENLFVKGSDAENGMKKTFGNVEKRDLKPVLQSAISDLVYNGRLT